MDAPIRYVRDKAAAAHIWDHLSERSDRALCGHFYNQPIELKQGTRPRSVCRACQALQARAEAVVWRGVAEEASRSARRSARDYRRLVDEYEALWVSYEDYTTGYETLRTDYERFDVEYEKLWASYEELGRSYDALAAHSDNQRKELFGFHNRMSKTSGSARQGSDAKTSGSPPPPAPPPRKKVKPTGRITPERHVFSGRGRVKFWH
jgi:hypothetical protein